jgi:hypothetical protein
MVGLLSAATSVLGGGGALGGGPSEGPSTATSSATSTFTSGAMTSVRLGSGWVLAAILVLIYLAGGRHGQ